MSIDLGRSSSRVPAHSESHCGLARQDQTVASPIFFLGATLPLYQSSFSKFAVTLHIFVFHHFRNISGSQGARYAVSPRFNNKRTQGFNHEKVDIEI